MTRSLSSPNAVERNQTAPSCSYTWPSLAQPLDRALDPALVVQPRLARPDVEVTPRAARLASMPSRTRPAAQLPDEAVGVGAGGRGGRPDVVGHARREVGDVVAVVAVLGHRLAAPERRDRRAEVADLAARVVEVVLARDPLAAGLEDATQEVADERAAGVADRRAARSGWPRRTRR